MGPGWRGPARPALLSRLLSDAHTLSSLLSECSDQVAGAKLAAVAQRPGTALVMCALRNTMG